MHIRVGTRGSRLALWQSEFVIEGMRRRYPEHSYETVVIRTKGDRIQDVSLRQIGDKGLFVREIEAQLLENRIDLAVHSMKDMPSGLPEGLTFAKAPKRQDARDVLILREGGSLGTLKKGACIGTGSRRRSLQLKALRPDLCIRDIRGNLDTRLQKLDGGEYDGIVLAAAGILRLGLESRITSYFSVEEMVPASAQGTLAVEVRKADGTLLGMLDALGDTETQLCVSGERAFLNAIGGSCHIPAGSYCRETEGGYTLHAVFGEEEGEHIVTTVQIGSDPIALGRSAAALLKEEMRKFHER